MLAHYQSECLCPLYRVGVQNKSGKAQMPTDARAVELN